MIYQEILEALLTNFQVTCLEFFFPIPHLGPCTWSDMQQKLFPKKFFFLALDNGITEMNQNILRNKNLGSIGQPEFFFSPIQLFISGWFSMRFCCILPGGQSKTNMCSANDQAWTRVFLGMNDCIIYCFHVIAIFNVQNLPTISGKASFSILRKGQICGTINRDSVVII